VAIRFKNLRLFLHIFFALVTVVILIWLWFKNFVPGGSVEYVQNFQTRNPFVSDLWPPESLEKVEDGRRPFITDDVTFFLYPPRYFPYAQLDLPITVAAGLEPQLFIAQNAVQDLWISVPWNASSTGVFSANIALDKNWRNAQKRYIMKLSVPGLKNAGEKAYVGAMMVRFSDSLKR
jgi:hypothetical protein